MSEEEFFNSTERLVRAYENQIITEWEGAINVFGNSIGQSTAALEGAFKMIPIEWYPFLFDCLLEQARIGYEVRGILVLTGDRQKEKMQIAKYRPIIRRACEDFRRMLLNQGK